MHGAGLEANACLDRPYRTLCLGHCPTCRLRSCRVPRPAGLGAGHGFSGPARPGPAPPRPAPGQVSHRRTGRWVVPSWLFLFLVDVVSRQWLDLDAAPRAPNGRLLGSAGVHAIWRGGQLAGIRPAFRQDFGAFGLVGLVPIDGLNDFGRLVLFAPGYHRQRACYNQQNGKFFHL